MENIGDKQYVAELEGDGLWVVRLNEMVSSVRSTFIARVASEATALKIAKALNEAEGL